MAIVTAEQRKDPSLAGWVAAKDKENATAKPVTPEQTAYTAAANQFTTNNWGPTGTANGKTESQNLAAVIQQPGNTTKTTATPYIAANGQTDYHISGQPTAQTATPVTGGGFNNPNTAGETPVTTPVSTPVAATSIPQQQTSTPQSQGNYPGQLTTAQIQAEAQARIDKQRAALMNAVTGAKTGLKNTYDYTQGLQKDNRVIEDSRLERTLNPFSGGTDYKEAMLSRDRQIADTASSKDYNNAVAGYDAQVASFDTLAPEQQNALIDELTRQERQYGLDVGSLTGQFNGGQTLAAKTADQNYQLGLSGLSGQLPNGGGQTLAAQQLASQQQNQQFSQSQQTQEFAYQQVRDVIKDKQYQQQFDQDVKQNGLEYALKQATLKNQITSDQAQRAISQQNANTASTNASNSQTNANQDNLMNIWKATGKAPAGIPNVTEGTPYAGQAGTTPKPVTADDFSKYIDGTPLVSNVGGIKTVTDIEALEKAILSSGMTPEEMTKAYLAYKIPMK